MIIHLHNLKFFSHHGIHEEEKILGTAFEVNVEVEIKHNDRIDTIHQTIDYVQVSHSGDDSFEWLLHHF